MVIHPQDLWGSWLECEPQKKTNSQRRRLKLPKKNCKRSIFIKSFFFFERCSILLEDFEPPEHLKPSIFKIVLDMFDEYNIFLLPPNPLCWQFRRSALVFASGLCHQHAQPPPDDHVVSPAALHQSAAMVSAMEVRRGDGGGRAG